tara:strand:+ start:8831 stop:9733 length:903 start_codon:yes stop_codon:yes gene_type:complete
MAHPNYDQWPPDARDHYDKTFQAIKKHGHVIKGINDIRLGLAYSIGASFSVDAEFCSFFPLKGEGLSVVSGVINRIITLYQNSMLDLKSQIIDNKNIYDLPVALVALSDDLKNFTESKWVGQLQRDSFLAEFSTDDHQLFLLLFTDKNGKMPWDPECENYWPDVCPRSLVSYAQKILTGEEDFANKKFKEDEDTYTFIRNVRYPLLAEISPDQMINAYKMGSEKWLKKYPNGNYKLLISTLKSLFENEVVVTQINKNYMYFDINNIPESFREDFPNNIFKPDSDIIYKFGKDYLQRDTNE